MYIDRNVIRGEKGGRKEVRECSRGRKDSGNEGCLNNPFFLATKVRGERDGVYIYTRNDRVQNRTAVRHSVQGRKRRLKGECIHECRTAECHRHSMAQALTNRVNVKNVSMKYSSADHSERWA